MTRSQILLTVLVLSALCACCRNDSHINGHSNNNRNSNQMDPCEDPAWRQKINAIVSGTDVSRINGSIVTEDIPSPPRLVGNCSVVKHQASKSTDEASALSPNTASLWPGALVQGRGLKDGILNPVTIKDHLPVTVFISGGKVRGSRTIEFPVPSKVNDARIELAALQGDDVKPDLKFVSGDSSSFEQAMFNFGFDIKWGRLAEFQGAVGKASMKRKHTAFMKITQKNYTLTVDPPGPEKFIGCKTSVDELKDYSAPDNPLAYVSSVTYGRMAIISISSDESVEEHSTSLRSKIRPGLGKKIEFTLDDDSIKEFKNLEVNIYILGGSKEYAEGVLGGDTSEKLKKFKEYLTNGNLVENSAPISYECAYLKDNTLAKLGLTTEYETAPNDCSCVVFNNIHVRCTSIGPSVIGVNPNIKETKEEEDKRLSAQVIIRLKDEHDNVLGNSSNVKTLRENPRAFQLDGEHIVGLGIDPRLIQEDLLSKKITIEVLGTKNDWDLKYEIFAESIDGCRIDIKTDILHIRAGNQTAEIPLRLPISKPNQNSTEKPDSKNN